MSSINRAPLGNFEERLLAQLQREVAIRSARPAAGRTRASRATPLRARATLLLTVAAGALIFAVLSALPGAQPALAKAFPILTQRTTVLPGRFERILRTQRLASDYTSGTGRAYAFRTPVGTGYVVVGLANKWLCILIPRRGADGRGSIRCETATRLISGTSTGLTVAQRYGSGSEIVKLVPRNAITTVITTDGTRSSVSRDGILVITATSSATVTTTVNGTRSTTTYRPS